MKVIHIIVIVLVAAVVAGLVGVRVGMRSSGTSEQALEVQLAAPTRGLLIERIAAPGELVPRRRVQISSRIPARITALPYREGQRVTAGEPDAAPPIPPSVLVRMEAADLEALLQSARARRAAREAQLHVTHASLEAAQARIEGLHASLAEAEATFRRHQTLVQTGDSSRAVFEAASSRYRELQAQLAAAEHDLESSRLSLGVIEHQLTEADAEIARAEDQLSHTIITAPMDGVVTQVHAEVGELVVTGTMNNPGTIILEVADLAQMLVVARVNEMDIGGVEPGRPVTVRTQAWPDDQFSGTVESVALTVSNRPAEGRVFFVEVLLDPTSRRLYSGLGADVEIETRRHEDALTIPSQAVLARRVDELSEQMRRRSEVDPGKSFATVVYVHREGRAEAVPVSIGPSDAARTVILSGLTAEDRVIVGPFMALEQLADGKKVTEEKGTDATDATATAE